MPANRKGYKSTKIQLIWNIKVNWSRQTGVVYRCWIGLQNWMTRKIKIQQEHSKCQNEVECVSGLFEIWFLPIDIQISRRRSWCATKIPVVKNCRIIRKETFSAWLCMQHRNSVALRYHKEAKVFHNTSTIVLLGCYSSLISKWMFRQWNGKNRCFPLMRILIVSKDCVMARLSFCKNIT